MPAKSFRLKLKVLSPIHIGSGESLSRLDYYLDRDRYVHRINFDTLFADPDFAPQRERFVQAASGGQKIGDLVPSELLRRHVLYRVRASQAAFDYINQRHILEIKTCIKSAGRVYIPGSSLKGAILSALCWDKLCNTDRTTAERVLFRWQEEEQQEYSRDPIDVTLRALGGRSGKFSRWLDVSDSDFKAPSACLEVSLVKVKSSSADSVRRPGSQSRDLCLLCESIQQKNEFIFTLKLNPNTKLTPDSLIKTVSEFYSKVAKRDSLETDRLSLPEENLIRLGSGSGRFATSLLLVAEDRGLHGYRLRPPATRKRAGKGDTPMGWAQMEVVR